MLLFSGTAYADLLDPLEGACREASEGDTCNAEGLEGTCEQGQCCRNDYSGEGGIPETVCEDCLRCVPSENPSGGSAGDTPQGGSAGDNPQGGDSPQGGEAGASAPVDTNQNSADDSDGDSGCASSANTPRNLGILSMVIGLLLAVRLRRTRDS